MVAREPIVRHTGGIIPTETSGWGEGKRPSHKGGRTVLSVTIVTWNSSVID